METRVDEIAPDVYRLCTYVPDADFQFNQYLVLGEEPLLFHTGPRALFPLVAEGMARVVPVDRLRWVTFGHVEADECGAMNSWLAAAPHVEVAHGALGCMVSVEDMADRPPRRLADGEVIDVGGRRLRHIDTPHVPHGWDAGVLFEETTGTLLCGDLFTGLGDSPALTERDIVGPAVQAEDVFGATCLTPGTAPALRGLAELQPTTLALMHGPAFAGDCGAALRDLADAYDARLTSAGARFSAPATPVPPMG